MSFTRVEMVSIQDCDLDTWWETGRIWVNIHQILSYIGVSKEKELNRLEEDPQTFKTLKIHPHVVFNGGYREKKLFIPLDNLNQYLFTFPSDWITDDRLPNLVTLQNYASAEILAHWRPLINEGKTLSGLDIRMMMIQESRRELMMVAEHLGFDWLPELVTIETIGQCKPFASMEDREMDLLNYAHGFTIRLLEQALQEDLDEDQMKRLLKERLRLLS